MPGTGSKAGCVTHLLCKTLSRKRRERVMQAGQLGASLHRSSWHWWARHSWDWFVLWVLSWRPVESQSYLSTTFPGELLLRHLASLTSLSQRTESGPLALTTAVQQSLPLSHVTTGLLQQQTKDPNSSPVKTGSGTVRLAPKAVILRPWQRELPSMYIPVFLGLMQLQCFYSIVFVLWQNRRKYITRP